MQSQPNVPTKNSKTRPDVKEFVRQSREKLRQSDDSEADHIIIQGPPARTTFSRAKIPIDDEDYIEISCRGHNENSHVMNLPRQIAFRSGWIKRLMTESKAQFKEHVTSKIDFPDYDSELLEWVFRWLSTDYKLNGDEEVRIIFQFPIEGPLVMEVLQAAHFLEIPPLIDACVSMLAEYLEDVPSFELVPKDIIEKIIPKLSPLQVCNLMVRPDFGQLGIDTSDYWKDQFEKRLWSLDPIYLCSWDKPSYVPVDLGQNVNWCTEFADRYLQDQLAAPVDSTSHKEIMDTVENIAKFVERHAHNGLMSNTPLLDYLPKLNLKYLEIGGVDLTEDTAAAILDYLTEHPECKTLKISFKKIDHSFLVGLLDNTKINLTSLDCDLRRQTNPHDFPLAKQPWLDALKANTSLKNLGLASQLHMMLSRDKAGVVKALQSHPSIQLLDLSGIGGNVDWNPLGNVTTLKTLIIQDCRCFTRFDIWNVLMDNINCLTDLDATNCDLDDSKVQVLCRSVLERNIPLKKLNLSNNFLQNESGAFLKGLLSSNTTLTSLNLSSTNIENGVATILSAKNSTLEILDIARSQLKSRVIANLSNEITLNGYVPLSGLRYLNVDFNDLTDDKVAVLRSLLPHAFIVSATYLQNTFWKYRGNAAFADNRSY
eukprot:TRINITY_DN6821_c0_g1_i1.p2 TRINITY_DN6821_c0_g1~~TRINITY_DN6821_c0_g1_i1.p2  ORF type:complete len:654 (-),score=171.48 TRINITY_DN6821_c0_g1_i1:53-2014(-)